MFLALLALCVSIWAQSPCGRGTPGQLATVAVWVRHNGSQSQFRISDEDLTDEEFQRSPADRDLFPIQLSRQPGSCPIGICALRLSASRRLKDGALIQQEDVFGVADGYESLHDDFYCGRAKGDCGADVPVYRFVRGRGPEATVAYSLDSAASFPGFGRDPRPLCYAWSETGSARKPVSGDQCLKIQVPFNSQIEYSTKDTASLSVGTTAFLHCSSGFVTAGPSSLLCTRSGWNPPLPGECVRQPTVPVLSAGSTPFGGMCTAGATVRNGQILYNQLEFNGRLPSGTVASVLCFIGFIPTITSSLKCEKGEWMGEWPRCISSDSVRCQPLIIPAGAKISYVPADTPFGIGSTATLSCPRGQAIAGAVRTTCGNDGWLPKTLGSCVTGLPCIGFPILNGNVTYIQASTTTPTAAGTSALITCNPGYTIQGSGSTLCTNGQWSPTPGSCTLSSVNSGSSGVQCMDFMAPISGTISYSLLSSGLGTHPSGAVATLACNLGSTVSGALSSTCTNGVWSPATLGTCSSGAGSSVLECTNPIVPFNGQIAYSQSNSLEPVKPVGTVATLTCSLDFTSSGAVSSTCLSGTWTPALGSCSSSPTSTTGQCLGGVIPPIGATITYSNGSPFGPYPAGSTATLSCTTGTVTGVATATCTSGQWSPTTLGTCSSSPTTGGTCTAPMVTGGTLTYNQIPSLGSYPSGTVATLACTTGSVTGSSTSTCLSGQWSPVIGTCGGTTGATCNGFFPPFGTTANYSAGGIFGPYNQGTTATLTCTTPGNVVSGPATVTCTNGQWSPSLTSSTCSNSGASTTCPSTVTPPAGGTITYSNGAIFGPFPANTVATLTCSQGVVQGLSTSTCTGGIWAPIGTCSGSTGGTQCTTAPVVPTGATLTYSNFAMFAPFPSGTVATMQCPGSTVQGSSTSTCTNGVWSPLGTCSSTSTGGQQCLTGATPPIGGTVTYSNFQVFPPFTGGTTATLTCPTGTVIGQSTSTCTNGQWTLLGTCSSTGGGGTPCITAVVPPIGATVTYSNGQVFAPFTGGTVATLTCPAGTIQGAPTATCSNGQWSQLGTCSGTSTGGQCPSAVVTPTGGTVTYSGGLFFAPFPSGTVATLVCTGSAVQGMSTATCSNGVWSSLGTCSGSGGQQCLIGITYPLGGTVTYSNLQLFAPFASGTTAILTCTNGVVIGAACSSVVTTPVGGTVTYSNGGIFPPFNSGTTATLQCTTGTVQGATTATCSNGQWTTIGTCSPGTGGQQCFYAIPTPSGGAVSYSNNLIFAPFSSGTTATLRCTVGTPIGGATTSTCSFGSWQPPSLANCPTTQSTGASCPAVAAPFGGTVVYSQSVNAFTYPDGTSATLTCTGGFPQGTSITYCTNGAWLPTLGSCSSSTNLQCSVPPTTPTSGTLSYSNGATFGPWPQGTTVTLTCPVGLYAQGSATATCFNGVWGSLATTCSSNPSIALGCVPFSSLASPMTGGMAVYTPSVFSEVDLGSSAALVCNPGYIAQGATSTICTASGWNPPTLGTCRSALSGTPTGTGSTCSPQFPPLNGNLTYSIGGAFGPYPSGTTVTVACTTGYTVNGVATSLCNNGQWVPSQLGTCGSNISGGASQCFSPQTTTSGTVNYSNGQTFGPWPSGTTATLVCSPPNFFSTGAASSVCSNGLWTPSQLGSCSSSGGITLSSCQAIPFIANGAVTYSQLGLPPYSEGATATLVCNFGSALSGQSTVTCRGGGWVPFPGLGSCQLSARSPARDVAQRSVTGGCPSPKAPPFGEISFSQTEEGGLFAVGTTAALRCNEGHQKKGATFATCRAGAFRPLLGLCEDDDTALRGACLPLQSPTNGRVTYIQASATVMLESGSTALLDCDDGFAVSGRATLSCSPDGSWEPSDGFGRCDLPL